MPTVTLHHLGYRFDDGESLFEHLSYSSNSRRIGLVGRNGSGKSMLGELIFGTKQPSQGTVIFKGTICHFSQHDASMLSDAESISETIAKPTTKTIAEYLGLAAKLTALQAINKGDACQAHFDMLNDDWLVHQELVETLKHLDLPEEPWFLCSKLSGGQRSRLRLFKLFQQPADLLILDEPSNHLDHHAKHWLLQQMKQYDGQILLISHDRLLLRDMDEICELSSLGLTSYGGNYDVYIKQKQCEQQSVARQLHHITKERKRVIREQQKANEKAAQRASKGEKKISDGSQPKILMDGKKNKAEIGAAKRSINVNNRLGHLEQKSQRLEKREEVLKTQRLYLHSQSKRNARVINIIDVKLRYGTPKRINFTIYSNQSVVLSGGNGEGKSTLLKTLNGEILPCDGEINITTPLCYLDQHFTLLKNDLSVMDNLIQQCKGLDVAQVRTVLAGIGFRGDSVFRATNKLSGGEKMKLAMLIVSHQSTQPFLLLDEPDNHLDLESKKMLAMALRDYRSGFMLVSHDQDFILETGADSELSLTSTD